MLKLFIKSLFLLPVLLCVILINLTYDPSYLFDGQRYEKNLATILLSGNNAGNLTNFDVKSFEKFFIENSQGQKDIIVVGSSTSLSLHQDLFPALSFSNNSINGADIGDYEFVFEQYLSKKQIPKKIIIGVDPWIFNKNRYSKSVQSKNSLFQNAIKPLSDFLNMDLNRTDQYIQVISPRYFQSSTKAAISELKGENNNKLQIIKDKNSSDIVRFSDGSMNLEKNFSTKPSDIKKAALSFDAEPLLGSYQNLDEYEINRFENLVKKIKEKQVELVIYLPPYNPLIYKNLSSSSKYKIITQVESYLKNFAQKSKVTIVGSYDPEKYNLQQTEFYDGIHPQESATRKIFVH